MEGANSTTQTTNSVPSSPGSIKIPFIQLGQQTADPFPCVDKIWEMFGQKGIRTVFLSIGSSLSCMPDLEISESLGCPLNIVQINSSEVQKWEEVQKILKDRKRDASGCHPFSEGAQDKWVLPKNIRGITTYPWFNKGNLEIDTNIIETAPAYSIVESVCRQMKLKDNAVRIDILKIDLSQTHPSLTGPTLLSFLLAGFRPAFLLVKWDSMPDETNSAAYIAGITQSCGYDLIKKLDNKFLYYYTENDLFLSCSWEQVSNVNPIIKEILGSHSTQTSLTSTEEDK